MLTLGIFHFPNYADPSAALLSDGKVIAFAEEERLVRNKHANAYFPARAVRWALKEGRASIQDLDAITIGWDCHMHANGELESHFRRINKYYSPSEGDRVYQQNRLKAYTPETYSKQILRNLRRVFGDVQFPPLVYVGHHLAHAVMAYFHSGFEDCLVLILDGSGEMATTTWWHGKNGALEQLHEIRTPHSLGWFYSAFTEYLGYEAYDGEYKVMGLAAYGNPDLEMRKKLEKLIWYDGKGGFKSRPEILSMGCRSNSAYFPDALVEYLGRQPRSQDEKLEQWHIDLSYEVQQRLERIVEDMLRYWQRKTMLKKLCVAGGVALNVKMNGNLFSKGIVEDIFVHPLSADTGMSIGSGMTYAYQQKLLKPSRLENIYFGPAYEDEEIEKILKACGLTYTRESGIEERVAQLLAEGRVVGWFQGRMEAGPRSLGNRSILADPRRVESRDKVNAIIKFREFWRPFCPAMTETGAERFLENYTFAPFMIITFDAKRGAEKEIAGVVHVDGTSRVQIVSRQGNPRFHRLLEEFDRLTGVPVVMNTSFNIKGEPIVCTPHDALRTFFATGMEALAIGPFLVLKPEPVVAEASED